MQIAAPPDVRVEAPALVDSTQYHRCWRARPLPRCDSFVLSDFTVAFPFVESGSFVAIQFPDGTQQQIAFPVFQEFASLELGVMRNTSPSGARGLSGFVGGGEAFRFGGHARYRRWLGPDLAADALAGFLITDVHPRLRRSVSERSHAKVIGFSGGAGLILGPWSASLRGELLPDRQGGFYHAFYVAGSAGGPFGAVLSGLFVLFSALLVAVLSSEGT